MKYILTIFLLTFSLPTMAQQLPEELKRAIINESGESIELNTERKYYIEKDFVIEEINLERSSTLLYNLFDFQNNIVMHRSRSNNLGLSITPFSQMPAPRLQTVLQYGCYLARKNGGSIGRATNDTSTFLVTHCQTTQ